MKLYYSPNTCSLADHIAFHEASISVELEKVDLRSKQTETGADFDAMNPKGYVPALILDSGEMLTENVAILDWIADQSDALRPSGPIARSRQIEMLGFISTEIHQQYGTFFSDSTDEQKAVAAQAITRRVTYISETMTGDYLLGDRAGVADFYLFVMLRWARKRKIEVPERMLAYHDRIAELSAVRQAMEEEGLV